MRNSEKRKPCFPTVSAPSLIDPAQAPRLRALADSLDTLLVACTSPAQAEALDHMLACADLTLPVLMAIDTGLRREGARDIDAAHALADRIRYLPHLRLHGLYTHEGHAYGKSPNQINAAACQIANLLLTHWP